MAYLNLNHLFYFYTIASEGSIREACEKLCLTQSTLSNQLKELELFFRQPLFERKSKKLILNDMGKKVLTYANDIFRMRDELTQSVKNHASEHAQIVKIGILPCFMRKDIYPIFRSLWSQNLALKSTQNCLSTLLSNLTTKNIDVIISDRPILHETCKLKNRELLKKRLVFVGHKKFSHAAHNFPLSLSDQPFSTYTGDTNSHSMLDEFFKANNLTPQIMGELDDINLLRLFAEDGKGIVAIPADLAEESIARGKLHLIGAPPELYISVWMISLANGKLENQLRKCIDDIFDNQIITKAYA